MRRYLVLGLLFLAVALAPAVLRRGDRPDAALATAPTVPREALDALRQGRYWRASRILSDYLATQPDSSPAALLLAAQAQAGWGDWAGVGRLLEGRPWLDTLEGGRAWALLARSRFEGGDWTGSSSAYDRFLRVDSSVGDRERGLVEVRRGLALQHADSERAALAALDTAAALLPALTDWIAIYAAEAAAAAGDTAVVERRLAGAPRALAARFGWEIRARALQQADDSTGAARVAESAAGGLDRTARGRAWSLAAALRLAAGDTTAAVADYRHALHEGSGDDAAAAARALRGLPGLDAGDHLAIGRVYLRGGSLERGVAEIDAYLADGAPSAAERDRLRYDIALAYFNAGRYAEAGKRLRSVAASTASRERAADALYTVARAEYRAGRRADALATLRRVAAAYPKQDAATQALFLIADLSHDAGDTATARAYYRRTVASNEDMNEAGLAMMRLADLSITGGDWQKAADIFEDYRRRHPSGRRTQQATYWAGRAYAKLGRDSLALARLRQTWSDDPFSYYGVRAGERLGRSLDDVPLQPSPASPDSLREPLDRALFRLDLLRDLEDGRAVSIEIERLRSDFDQPQGSAYRLAEALDQRGYTVSGISMGWEIHRRERGWNPRLLRIVYPLPYETLVAAVADERGLDPALVAGLIRQESMFSAGVSSAAGAIGLMQVMPATGRLLARGAGMHDFDPQTMLRQPEINLEFGSRYLKDLVSDYDGRIAAILAAYNAGPSRVERWQDFPEWREPELFTERIPYTETRNYVKIVQANISIYRLLYPSVMSRAATGDPGVPTN